MELTLHTALRSQRSTHFTICLEYIGYNYYVSWDWLRSTVNEKTFLTVSKSILRPQTVVSGAIPNSNQSIWKITQQHTCTCGFQIFRVGYYHPSEHLLFDTWLFTVSFSVAVEGRVFSLIVFRWTQAVSRLLLLVLRLILWRKCREN